LGIGDPMSGAEDAKKLVAFAFDAPEEAKSGLFENASYIGYEERGEQKNGFTPQ
jgi:hypothetical protein